MQCPTKPPPVPGSKGVFLAILIGAALIITPFIWFGVRFIGYKRGHSNTIAAIEAKIRSRGEPVSLEELIGKLPKVSEEENGATALMTLWEKDDPALWQAFRNQAAQLPERRIQKFGEHLPFLGSAAREIGRTSHLTETQRIAVAAYEPVLQQHVADLEQALRFRTFRFPIRYADGMSMMLPHLTELRVEANRLRLATLLSLERGNVEEAIDHEQTMARLVNVPRHEPLLISGLTRLSCSGIFLNEFERILSRTNLTAAQLERFSGWMRELPAQAEWREMLISERVFRTALFSMSGEEFARFTSTNDETNKPPVRELDLAMIVLGASGIRGGDHLFMLETFETASRYATNSSPKAITDTEQLFENVRSNALKFPPKLFSAIYLSPLSRVAVRYASFEARRRCAETAIAVELYRAASDGRLPPDIHALTPRFMKEIPMDPFDGNPLRFKTLEPGYVIYSIGANRKDDGGIERNPRKRFDPSDETFAVQR